MSSAAGDAQKPDSGAVPRFLTRPCPRDSFASQRFIRLGGVPRFQLYTQGKSYIPPHSRTSSCSDCELLWEPIENRFSWCQRAVKTVSTHSQQPHMHSTTAKQHETAFGITPPTHTKAKPAHFFWTLRVCLDQVGSGIRGLVLQFFQNLG